MGRLDSELIRLTVPDTSPAAQTHVGVEHEYRVLRDDRTADFRALVHSLALDGRRLDPGDANAYRCTWGGQITCDEAEAEVVTPPEPAVPGFAPTLIEWSTVGRRHLESSLDPAHSLRGYSTHLNVSTPRALEERACRLATRTFAPALMLMLDGPTSHGVAIRPRSGRAELCGEFADGDRLAAAAIFWTGSVLAATAAIAGDFSMHFSVQRAQLPPPIAANVVPDVERYGWVLYRNAFGFDLYAQGRGAAFERSMGGTISAQAHLDLAWEAARAALDGVASPEEFALVDRIVIGDLPLGIEGPLPAMSSLHKFNRTPRRPMFGEVLAPMSRGSHEVRAVVATWDHTVFRLGDGSNEANCVFACIPRAHLPRFLDGLADGRLGPVINAALDAAPIERVLDEWSQTAQPGFYGGMRAAHLAAPERHPLADPADEPALMRAAALTPLAASESGSGTTQLQGALNTELERDPDRPGKWRVREYATGTNFPWWAWALLVVLFAFGAGVAVGYLTGKSETVTEPSTTTEAEVTTSTAPPATTMVVTNPEITEACVFTDHFPEATDYPGVAIGTPSIIVVDLVLRGVAPGTELNVLTARPRILQGNGIVGDDGRVRVVLGISSYGTYEIVGVTLGDGTRLPFGPMPSMHVVNDGEGAC